MLGTAAKDQVGFRHRIDCFSHLGSQGEIIEQGSGTRMRSASQASIPERARAVRHLRTRSSSFRSFCNDGTTERACGPNAARHSTASRLTVGFLASISGARAEMAGISGLPARQPHRREARRVSAFGSSLRMRLDERVDADRAGEPIGRSFPRRLRATSQDFHVFLRMMLFSFVCHGVIVGPRVSF